jgi:hypothetical protein
MTRLPAAGRSATVFRLFLVIWALLNLVQAGLTPLNNDEAYYWMYSKYPAWGYFDHPPMIALMIKAGYALFHCELGVRFVTVISEIIALTLIWSLTDDKQKSRENSVKVFILIAVILPVFNIFGFIATPDSPLLLFSAIFLVAYKKFLNEENWKNTIFLSIAMAALVYSKYHGALLIILIILSNLKILKSPRFWLSSGVALLLFMPHVYWQYVNGFPSLRYHLIERVGGFNPGNIPEYLLNLFLIHNPFILPLALWLVFSKKQTGIFDRGLKFVMAGFIIFFLVQSLRYHIEPQWTAVISVPMLIIVFNSIAITSSIGLYLKRVALFFIPLLLFARAAFMFDFLPVSYLKKEYHNNEKRAIEIGKIAGERPVVFTNSYQDPSEYSFYTGKMATTLNNLNYRKNQYDIWNFEEQIHGTEVLYVPHYLNDYITGNFTKLKFSYGDSVYVRNIVDFQSLQKECIILEDANYTFSRNHENTIHLSIFNPYPYQIRLNHPELPVVFQVAFLKNGYREVKKNLELPAGISIINSGDTIKVDCRFTLEELPEGDYRVAICSETGFLYDVYNSRFSNAKVKE